MPATLHQHSDAMSQMFDTCPAFVLGTLRPGTPQELLLCNRRTCRHPCTRCPPCLCPWCTLFIHLSFALPSTWQCVPSVNSCTISRFPSFVDVLPVFVVSLTAAHVVHIGAEETARPSALLDQYGTTFVLRFSQFSPISSILSI